MYLQEQYEDMKTLNFCWWQSTNRRDLLPTFIMKRNATFYLENTENRYVIFFSSSKFMDPWSLDPGPKNPPWTPRSLVHASSGQHQSLFSFLNCEKSGAYPPGSHTGPGWCSPAGSGARLCILAPGPPGSHGPRWSTARRPQAWGKRSRPREAETALRPGKTPRTCTGLERALAVLRSYREAISQLIVGVSWLVSSAFSGFQHSLPSPVFTSTVNQLDNPSAPGSKPLLGEEGHEKGGSVLFPFESNWPLPRFAIGTLATAECCVNIPSPSELLSFQL